MIGNLIQQQFYGADNWPFGAALTVVLMAFLMLFVTLLPARRPRPRSGGRRSHEWRLRPARASSGS